MMLAIIIDIIITVFFLILLSYYFLLLRKQVSPGGKESFDGISIIIPARNEEAFIGSAISSAMAARFSHGKEIIVIDDASNDRTKEVARSFGKSVRVFSLKEHSGKAKALNYGISKAKYQLVAVMDGDSVIGTESLIYAMDYLKEAKTCAVTSTIKVKNRNSFLGMWLHIEQVYNSLIRALLSKINACITTPGPLSIYKKRDLLAVGGFSSKGYSEDVDIAVKLIRAGKKIAVSEKSIVETNMPTSVKGFVRQRVRFAKGWIHIFRKHLSPGRTIVDAYSLPIAFFWFVQAAVMSVYIISQMLSGYLAYFFLRGDIISLGVIRYFFEWLSIIGLLKWGMGIISGTVPLDYYSLVSIATTLLSYPLYFYAIFKYDKRFDLYHLIPLIFMFPFWLMIMLIYVFNLGELISGLKENRWEKVN